MKKRSAIWKTSREEFIDLLNRSETFTQVLSSFGLRNVGSNYKTLVSRLKHEKLDWNKFKDNKAKITKFRKIRPLKALLIKNSDCHSSSLKSRVIKERLLIEQCYECGQAPIWNDKKLVLVLDHKNGDHYDNRLENLQLLCPNCNSQTKTFAGRNLHYPPKVKKEIDPNWRKRPRISRRKVLRPDINSLKEDIKNLGWSGTGRKYGVSDNAIRKWIYSSVD